MHDKENESIKINQKLGKCTRDCIDGFWELISSDLIKHSL